MKETMICGPFAWIFQIWSHYLVPLFIRKEDGPCLPNDVLINILSRLPADYVVKFRRVCRHWQALTSSPSFVRLQLQRATPAVLVQYKIERHSVGKDGMYLAVIGETDRKSSKYEPIRVDSRDRRKKIEPIVILSCDGLLLIWRIGRYFIFNPVTKKKLVLAKPRNIEGRFCGLFFHPLTSEYKLLLVEKGDSDYQYFIYSFGTRMWRPLALKTSFEPSRYGCHATLDGALHWIVGNDDREMSNCEDAIMVYKMDTEDFFTIPHPGNACFLKTRHTRMCLFEKERKLCFCNRDIDAEVVHVWMLMDYANRTWIKKYRVRLDLGWRKFPMEEDHWYKYDMQLLNIWNDQLILDWNDRGIFRCHLWKKAVQKIACPKTVSGVSRVYSNAFTKSLVTLG